MRENKSVSPLSFPNEVFEKLVMGYQLMLIRVLGSQFSGALTSTIVEIADKILSELEKEFPFIADVTLENIEETLRTLLKESDLAEDVIVRRIESDGLSGASKYSENMWEVILKNSLSSRLISTIYKMVGKVYEITLSPESILTVSLFLKALRNEGTKEPRLHFRSELNDGNFVIKIYELRKLSNT